MSKIAQVATGTQTCQRCGRTKPFEDFQLSRWGRPVATCRECHTAAVALGRKAGAKKRAAARAAEERRAAKADASTPTPDGTSVLEIRTAPGSDLALRLTRVAGMAHGAALLDDRLVTLADEIDHILTDLTGEAR